MNANILKEERIESIQINFFFFIKLVTRAVVWHPFTSIIVNHLNSKRNRNSHSLSQLPTLMRI